MPMLSCGKTSEVSPNDPGWRGYQEQKGRPRKCASNYFTAGKVLVLPELSSRTVFIANPKHGYARAIRCETFSNPRATN